MTKNQIAAAGVFFLLVLGSCGTNKKLQTAETEIANLNNKNQQLTEKVNELSTNNQTLTEQNKKLAGDMAQYQQQCEAMQAKYKRADDVLREQDNLMRQIEEKLVAALADLEDRGMSVHYDRGLLFVSMEDQLLFRSGSTRLEKSGTEALSKIATVMRDYPDVKLIVVGNTDDQQVKKGMDNWSLSTERANGVVRALRDIYKMDPARLTSAGRGKYNPVADNSSEEGRAKNRRIDFIFNPNLEKLWDSL